MVDGWKPVGDVHESMEHSLRLFDQGTPDGADSTNARFEQGSFHLLDEIGIRVIANRAFERASAIYVLVNGPPRSEHHCSTRSTIVEAK